MSKIANVLYAYAPKNDDELELTVGDKIEVIGHEEEGWWSGRLKGRVGVFPSNFVQVVETGPAQQQQQPQQQPPISNTNNKLNSLFGSLVNAKNNISSNSLSNISSNSNNNLNISNNNNNINASTSSSNLIMNNNNNTQQLQSHENDSTSEYPFQSSVSATAAAAEESLHSTSSFSERRPKPLRGIGFGDIFAAGAKAKPLPADPSSSSSLVSKITTAMASERHSTNSSASTLKKPVPKKPPPPAPVEHTSISNTNGSPLDQAPALPPKPGNSYSPFLQQQSQQQQRPLPQPSQQRVVREQARVIYAYTPTNSDELEMQVGDVIDIIDKNIEDQGWWKGELKGKIGVFPDNFVQLIGTPEVSPAQDWQNSFGLSAASNHSNNTSNNSSSFSNQQQPVSSTEGRIKSVFAGTPKGFSKELESNLEKHSNPASFLSLKRNKLQQNSSPGLSSDNALQSPMASHLDSTTSAPSSGAVSNSNANSLSSANAMTSDSSERQNGHTSTSPLETSPGKLNHITANRAKGPTRRPPKNILNKRNQLNDLASGSNTLKARESIELKDDQPSASLPAFNQSPVTATTTTTTTAPSQVNSEPLSSLPAEQKQQVPQPQSVSAHVKSLGSSPFTTPTTSEPVSPLTAKNHSSPNNNNSNHVPDGNQAAPPKTNQRAINQGQIVGQQDSARSKLASSAPTSSSTPPWMVELRKTNAEKKRDPVTSVDAAEEIITTPISVPATPVVTRPVSAITTTTPTTASSVSTPITPTTTFSAPIATAAISTPHSDQILAKYDNMLKQISKDVHNEINELKGEVRRLREDFKGMNELKEALEAMKVELRTCQSATESQRRYIKDLVNNLADERKRIAAMQVEIDRNLK